MSLKRSKWKKKVRISSIENNLYIIEFSMELERTISSTKAFQRIQNYEKFESLSTTYFNSNPNLYNKKKRGLKQCYLYFLMDPRISRNLPVSAKENVIIM